MDPNGVTTARFMDGFQPGFSKAEMHRTRDQTRRAIKRGELIQSKGCELCGWELKRLHKHHPRYDQHLNVLFLCVPCHVSVSVEERRLRHGARMADLRRANFGY